MRVFAAVALVALAQSALAAPTVSTYVPAQDASGVHARSPMTLTFSEAVTAQPAKLIELRRQGSDHVISAVAAVSSFVTVAGSAVTVTFPTKHMTSGNVYVFVEAGAFTSTADDSSFTGIASGAWKFRYKGENDLLS
jgi:methionine-rich copper-binding protein CopC